jgi:hypothetical protein
MAESSSSALSAWSSFYTVVGSSAAALTGLVFVVISLVPGRERQEGTPAGIAAFATPTVMHFTTALLISGVLIMPWRALVFAAAVTAGIGLYGFAHILRAMYRATRLTVYTPDIEDWIWFMILPFVAYGAIFAAAIALAAAAVQALFVVAGGVLLLVFIGIRNAWDIVTYIAIPRG